MLSSLLDMTPIFWYSPTRFSKKFVFPSREMASMKSKGFVTLYTYREIKYVNTNNFTYGEIISKELETNRRRKKEPRLKRKEKGSNGEREGSNDEKGNNKEKKAPQ